MEFASSLLSPRPCPEPTERTGGTLQRNLSCQMFWDLNKKIDFLVLRDTHATYPKVSTPAHVSHKQCPSPSKLHAAQGTKELRGLTVPSTSAGGTQLPAREERSGDTDGHTYGLSHRFRMAAATGFLLKNIHLKAKTH